MIDMVALPLIKFERNESVYSILARAHYILGHNDPLRTLTLITGVPGYKPMSGLPTRLKEIIAALKIDASTDRVINENTHYPLYKPFLKAGKRESIVEAMCNCGAVKSRIGLLRNHVGALESIKSCGLCVKEDIERCGFPYWHREHLASWVYFCPHHQEPLSVFDSKMGNYSHRNLILPLNGNYPQISASPLIRSKLLSITEETMNLFNRNHSADMSISVENYRQLLEEKNVCNTSGRVHQKEIYDAVTFWLKDLKDLPGFDSLYDALEVERSWASMICTKRQRFHHPLKHIIFLKSLGLSLTDLFQTDGCYSQQALPLFKTKKLKPSDEDIRNAISKTDSMRSAAKLLKVDVTALCCDATRLGIKYRHRAKFITESVIHSVINQAKNGRSTATIATTMGISETSVNRIKHAALPKI